MAWGGSKAWSAGQRATSSDFNTYFVNNLLAIYPVGAYVYVHQTPTAVETKLNNKFLECNGVAVSRTTYATLFGLVASTYGAGDGSTTFNLPDLRGRAMVCIAGTGGHSDVTTLGNNDGVALASRRPKHAHTFSNASHTHTWSGSTGAAGNHQHTSDYPNTNTIYGGTGSDSTVPFQTVGSSSTSGGGWDGHTHTYTPGMTSVTFLSAGGSYIGPDASTPNTDTGAYLVGGVWMIAYA